MPRLLTYNVHRCVGTDKRLDVARVSAVIAEFEPDIVCLQELDEGRTRTGLVDQAAELAHRLAMGFRFHPAMRMEIGAYGDAILTALPERLIRADALPTVSGIPGLEPRGAVWVQIRLGERWVNVVNTHLGLVPHEQRLQAATLIGPGWLDAETVRSPTILAGDFNATSITRPYQILTGRLADAQRRLGRRPSLKTFPSAFPAIRIDHVFVSRHVRVTGASVPGSLMARQASDHLPLVIDFDLID